jgi:hypothetical protein
MLQDEKPKDNSKVAAAIDGICRASVSFPRSEPSPQANPSQELPMSAIPTRKNRPFSASLR